MSKDDPEDILAASIQSLYGFEPIAFSSARSLFTHRTLIQVETPDTWPSNWSLHASSLWISALFIADHVQDLRIPHETTRSHVLELGACAGLPSILVATLFPSASVTASDYPDDRLIQTLSDNVRRNAVSDRCRVVPHAWGTDPRPLLPPDVSSAFDVVFAADTLYDPEMHAPLLDTLCACLGRGPDARIHLVAGFHTGRYTIQSFLDRTRSRTLVLESATERRVDGSESSRPWDVSRAETEDEQEKRRWVVWIVLKWADASP